MSDNDVAQIKDRLTKLETAMEQKWMAHDTRSSERWADLRNDMHTMISKLDARPCQDHAELMLSLNHRITIIERIINITGWALGVLYATVIGAIIKHVIP